VPVAIAVVMSVHVALIWHQKHTQFPGKGKTEDNVVGSRLWPTYATKSTGLFFLIAAVLSMLGGLVQINPVWLYGPFRASTVSSPAQPDWYLGWIEGALRIFPPWEIRLFGHEIPNPFFPGVLLPTITFGLLYAWPFLEAKVTKDRSTHHLLDRPRDRPVRTALGVATLTLYALLLGAASNDLLAHWLGVSIRDVTIAFQVLVLVVPPAMAYVTYRLCRSLAVSGADRLTTMPAAALRTRGRTPQRRRDRA